MTKALPPCLKRIDDWRPLYRAAILETNKKVSRSESQKLKQP